MSTFVYQLLDINERILYIGYTANLKMRLANHQSCKSWWPLVDSVAISEPMPRDEALVLERLEIAELHPIYNIQNRRNIFPPAPPTNLIGSAEAAQILRCDRATFNRWAVKGKVPTAIKAFGRTQPRLFDRAEIVRIAKKQAA